MSNCRSFKSPRLTDEKKDLIADLYRSGVCPLQISKRLGITSKTVYVYLDKFGLRTFSAQKSIRRLYILDDDYFAEINDKRTAYWLGFIAAKAKIDIRNRFILVEIAAKDLSMLQDLLIDLKSTYIVHHKIVNGYIIYYVKLYSRKLIKDLVFWGVAQDDISWPVRLPNIFFRDYIRGFFDGRGSWTLYPERNVFIFSVRCRKPEMLVCMMQCIADACVVGQGRLIPKKTGYVLQYSGKQNVNLIYDYLYESGDQNIICLRRKMQRARSALAPEFAL